MAGEALDFAKQRRCQRAIEPAKERVPTPQQQVIPGRKKVKGQSHLAFTRNTDESAQLSLKSDLAVALFFSFTWSQPGFPIKPRRERDFLAHLLYLSQGLRLLCQTHSLLALTQAILDLSLSSIRDEIANRKKREPERGFNLPFRLDPWPRLAIYNSYNRAWLLGRAYSDWHRGFWTSTPKRALISLATSSCLALRLENEKDTTSAGPGPLHTRTGSWGWLLTPRPRIKKKSDYLPLLHFLCLLRRLDILCPLSRPIIGQCTPTNLLCYAYSWPCLEICNSLKKTGKWKLNMISNKPLSWLQWSRKEKSSGLFPS